MNLNELAGNEVPTAWLSEPRWYLWDGGFLLLGRSEGIVRTHAHHAIQIVVALDGDRFATTCFSENWRAQCWQLAAANR